jgi:rod shape-determining protein MreC
MARKNIKISSGVVFAVLLICANILLLLPQKHTKQLNYFFVRVTSPLLNLIPRSQPSKNDTVSKSLYNELVMSHENLQSRFQHVVKINRKLTNVRDRLNLPAPGPGLIIANISKVSINGQRSEIIINRGSDDGLKKKQYVLSAERGCVIGTISELSANMSRVQLVSDTNHHIMVDIWRDGVNLLISGQMRGDNKMNGKMPQSRSKLQGKIPLVETDFDIREGDSVFARIAPGLLETSLIIGKITKIEPDERKPLLWDITVTPVVDIRALTDVAVIVVDMNTSAADEEN